MTGSASPGTSATVGNWITHNQRVAAALPDAGEKWVDSDRVDAYDTPPEVVREHLTALRRNSLVKVVGEVAAGPGGGGKTVNVYSVPEHVARQLPDENDLPEYPGPCNHSGVRTLGGGEWSCTDDDCDVRFGAAVARRRYDNL